MKFVINFLALAFAAANVSAAPIKIFYEQETANAPLVKEIFVNGYSIPEDLIELKMISKCDDLKEKGKLDLCLNNNGDLLVVSVDRGFISESLTVFRAP